MSKDINLKRLALREANRSDNVLSWKKIAVLEDKLDSALDVEERYWRQRARTDWLQHGDKNSRFFHAKESARKARNKISGLRYSNGQWKEAKRDLPKISSQQVCFLNSRIKRLKRKKGSMALKLDMSKAYDRVEWVFLEGMLHRLGFPVQWVKLVIDCVSTVNYSFKLNGEILGNINPSRGLRQGDPLSPYLFLICVEGLSSLIHKALSSKKISGFKCSRKGPNISHLFFADDNLIFTKADDNNCLEVRKVLETYSSASGQLVNYGKSAMCFSASISDREGDRLASIVGESLAAKTLKACYFPNCNFMEATKKSSGSFLWNSLLWGKDLLEKGLRWRVGNGASIRIYKDKWVPRPHTFNILSAPSLDVQYNSILKIPLGSSLRADSLIWHFEGNGVYSVKSGHWLGCNSNLDLSSSYPPNGKNWWNLLWKLDLPLRREEESTMHALWDCHKLRFARSTWLPKNVVIQRNYATFLDFISDIATRTNIETLRTLCIIWWRIWFLRNSWVHKSSIPDYSDVVWWSRNFAAECRATRVVKDQGLMVSHKGPSRWLAPTLGSYKVNCCAISDLGRHRVGIGIVIRDSSGHVKASCCQFLEAVFDSHVAAIMAILRGILFSKYYGLDPGVVESDNTVAVERVLSNNLLNASFGTILCEIADQRSQLQGLKIITTFSCVNRAATRLAKLALETLTSSAWMEDYPVCLRDLIEADMPS
ncbi:hypothetical protein Dsin_005335 [Dipteronia sinensis]|uniref:Reverse transcriptase domain-containing protein n=1 Tax=Dipteronia sinensis TaxID=43782 RepID=A0AAE0EEI5_9ROSI|nr:hypothetical protein Dsin_005335 [Dipteronia sinensis]